MRRTDNPAWRLVGLLVVLVIFGTALTFTLVTAVRQTADLRDQTRQACVNRKHTYDALHAVIVEQNKVQPASPIILRAFPQFRPFYTPGRPEYEEAQRIADERRDRAFSVLGARPAC